MATWVPFHRKTSSEGQCDRNPLDSFTFWGSRCSVNFYGPLPFVCTKRLHSSHCHRAFIKKLLHLCQSMHVEVILKWTGAFGIRTDHWPLHLLEKSLLDSLGLQFLLWLALPRELTLLRGERGFFSNKMRGISVRSCKCSFIVCLKVFSSAALFCYV